VVGVRNAACWSAPPGRAAVVTLLSPSFTPASRFSRSLTAARKVEMSTDTAATRVSRACRGAARRAPWEHSSRPASARN